MVSIVSYSLTIPNLGSRCANIPAQYPMLVLQRPRHTSEPRRSEDTLAVPSWRQDFKPKCSGCHGLTIETRLTIEYYWDTTWVPTCLYLSGIFLINIFSPFQFFQKNNGFTTKCRGSSLEESAMGLGNFTTNCLALESPFFDQISIFIHGPRYFFYKVTCHPKLKWALDLFTRWPHYKMTHKNPFCSGLKATHFVWEMRRRVF